ncbi:MAG TPA: TIGR03085 family metal-binding protein [Streptosporangiaceae bacterium]|nr:TIGR03085 family metal-binding protein [Streptosporangiaceae bacterium]
MTYARDERVALCALLDEAGPREPTLCEGWATLDLAAHLVLREHRPDAGAGMLGGPLAAYTAAVQRKLAERNPYQRLVQMIRSGPPRLSVFGLPGMDERLNAVEFFVHHEDVRRAQPGWEPRKLDQGLSEELWRRLGMARFILRKAPVGVELVRDDEPGPTESGMPRIRITAKARTPVVTVIGSPAELTMWVFGRTAAARVRLDGSEDAVGAIKAASWRL